MWAVCFQSCGKAKPRGKTSFRRKAYIGREKKKKRCCSLGTGNSRCREARGSWAKWGVGEMQGPVVSPAMLDHFHPLCLCIHWVRWLLPRNHTRKGHYSTGWKESTSLLSKRGKVPIPSWAHCPKLRLKWEANPGPPEGSSSAWTAGSSFPFIGKNKNMTFFWQPYRADAAF